MITFVSQENWVDTVSPEEKGYPSIITPVQYFVGSIYPKTVGYTSFSDMGDFFFVGNTYIVPEFRGKGYYKQLLSDRNNHLRYIAPGKPMITVANPIENTDPAILEYQVAKQGGQKVLEYEDVSDIMSLEVFEELSTLPMFIYR